MVIEIKKVTLELGALRKISNSIGKIVSADIPNEKVRYRLSMLAKLLTNELTDLEQARQRLVKELGEKDAEGNLRVTDEREVEFNKRFDELQSESVGVSYVPVDLSRINLGLNALDMLSLEPFLDERYIEKLMTDEVTEDTPK